MNRTPILLSVIMLLSQFAWSDIIPLSLILDADSEEVHFVRGWLEAPAHVDLSEVSFITTMIPSFDDDFFQDDDEENDDGLDEDDIHWNEDTPIPTASLTTGPGPETPSEGSGGDVTDAPRPASPVGDDTTNTPQTGSAGADEMTAVPQSAPVVDGSTEAPASGGGDDTITTPTPTAGGIETSAPIPAPTPNDQSNTQTPAPTGIRRTRNLDEGGETTGGEASGGAQRVKQVLDVVLFYIPSNCKKNSWGGCDWSALGIGVKDDAMPAGVNYCCSENTVSRGLCSSDMMGQLIVNHNVFHGERRIVDVPTTPDTEFSLDDALFQVDETGDYVVLLANCDDYGLDVFSLGSMEWKSVKGYLPGEMFSLMFFYVVLVLVYLILVLWYWCGMRMYQAAAIPIQKFILATIILGLLEFFFRALDLGTWNLDGIRSKAIVWSAVILGVLKRGITRCLFVMVSMGWGVVRDTLGLALMKIIILGLLYCGLTMLRDFFLVLAVDKVESWSASAEEELVDFTLLISLAVVAVNLIFFFWIIFSLFATTEYLKNMNQTTKLQRHLRLRCVIMTAFTIAIAWFIFSVVDGVMGILSSDQYWLLEGAMHLNNLFVIVSVAILWRPNSNAKDYAMQMELPSMGDDGENELELSCVVPSAGELEDGNDPDHRNGLRVDAAVAT